MAGAVPQGKGGSKPGTVSLSQGEEKSLQVSWRRNIVQTYTRLDLTVATDRLPALAGLAEAAGWLRPAGDRYLAGLWRSSLVADLLWRVAGWSESRRLPAGWAPSWSWGSVTGAVVYDTVLEAALENRGGDRGLFRVEDVRLRDGMPGALVACCCTVPVRVLTQGPDFRVEVEPVNGPAGLKLSVSWDYLDSRLRGDQTQFFFVVFGTRLPSHGPFGILLGTRPPRHGSLGALLAASPLRRVVGTTKKFQRLGFVDGYQQRSRLRHWDSGGWKSEDEDSGRSFSSSKAVHSHPVRETQQGSVTKMDREAWIRAVLDSTRRRVEIV